MGAPSGPDTAREGPRRINGIDLTGKSDQSRIEKRETHNREEITIEDDPPPTNGLEVVAAMDLSEDGLVQMLQRREAQQQQRRKEKAERRERRREDERLRGTLDKAKEMKTSSSSANSLAESAAAEITLNERIGKRRFAFGRCRILSGEYPVSVGS